MQLKTLSTLSIDWLTDWLLKSLLALADTVFLGSESHGTHDHILPSWRHSETSEPNSLTHSRFQSSKLLLALASIVALGFGPRRDSWPYFCPFRTFTCFEMGPPLRREEGSDYYWGVTLLALSNSVTVTQSLSTPQTLESKSKLCYDQLSVGPSIWVSSPIWGSRLDFFFYSWTVAGLLMWGALSDEKTHLPFTIAAGPRQRSHSRILVPREIMTIFYCLRFETTPTWRARSPYLYPLGTGWPGYTPRHWVLISSPTTTRRATLEVASARTS
jgi:hypothetical protein